jgi:hypothetical protein
MPSPDDLSFDAVTAVHPTDEEDLFTTDIHHLWAVGDKPNGGYLQSILAVAARVVGQGDSSELWDVTSCSITFLRPPAFGPASVRTKVLRAGRSVGHVRATLVQDGAELADAVFVLNALAAQRHERYDGTEPLDVAPPDRCVRLPPQIPGGARVGIMEVLDLRLDPSTVPFGEAPQPDGARAELRGWTRFADGREPDPLSLLFTLDAIPPATLMIGSTGWVPTLQMSSYVRARPAPGWLGIRMTAHLVTDGTVDETCVVWDSTGHVVGQSTQIARLRFPDDIG